MTKEQLRRNSLDRLRKIGLRKKYYFSKIVNKNLLFLLNKLNIKKKSVLVYMPMLHEAEIFPTIRFLQKKSLVLAPLMQDISCKMVKLRLPLVVNKYKIKEPKVTYRSIKSVDLVIVPIIAFDKKFRRVGFGKGIYDRLSATFKTKSIVIFVQTVLCYEDSVVTNHFDIGADYVVTAEGIFTKAMTYDNNNTNFSHSFRGRGVNFLANYKKNASRQVRFFSKRSKSKG